jgi:RHS repeat-associated protein
MGRPAAKKGDKIFSMTPGDIHMVQPPFGPPVPLPHPCKSDIKMKLAKQVNVQGKAGAVKGSKSRHMPPHFPTPPGVSFVRPPKNQGEVFTGSSNVNYEGRAAAMLGDTGLMCCDPTDMPVGVLVVPPGTVYVGGGMTGGAAARARARIAAMKAAAAKCHEWINNNMPPGAAREEAHRKVCEDTGHPVDVATGKVFTGVTLVQLRGRIPVRLAIDYSTARAQEDGPFGHGWRHELERHLLITDDFIAHRNQHGHFAAFAPIGAGEEAQNLADGLTLYHHGHYLAVRDASGLEDVFLLPEGYKKGWMLPLAGMRDAFRNCVRLHYDDRRLARIIDSAGREVQLTYGGDNRVIQVLRKDDPQVAPQPIITCRYDRAGDLIAVGDPSGHERRFDYDHHLLVREVDRNGFSFYFAYDEAQRCVLTWGDGGKLYRRLAYDPERQLSHVVDSYGGQTLHRLGAGGRVEDTIDPLGHEWSKVLDDDGHLLSETDPNGGASTYAYDETGRLIERNPDHGPAMTIERDELGRITALIYESGGETRFERDPRTGRILRQTYGDLTFSQRWDEHGDLVEIARDGETMVTLDHDDRGFVTCIDHHDGYWQRQEYTPRGQVARIWDSAGFEMRLAWDHLGEMTAMQRPDRPAMTFHYNAEGQLIERQTNGAVARFTYPTWLVPETAEGDALRQKQRLGYDLENRVTSMVNGRDAEHRFARDLCGRIFEHRGPDGGTTRFERDPAGRLAAIVDRAGRRATLEYNDQGQVWRRIEADGTVSEWEYDYPRGLVRHANADVTGDVAWKDQASAVGETLRFADGGEHIVECDAEGYLVLHSGSLRIGHLAGPRGRTGAVVCSAWRQPLRYRYRERKLEAEHANGVREILHLDERGRRQEQIMLAPGGEVINRRRLHLGNDGLPASIADDLRGESRFRYDPTGRLVQVERPGDERGDETYRYDDAENLTRGAAAWDFDRADRLLRRPGYEYAYDACGNRIEQRSAEGTTRYRFDGRGQLAETVLPEGRIVRYRYDALGRRVRKEIDGQATTYLWNGHVLLAELSDRGPHRSYVYHRSSYHLIGWIDVEGDGPRCYFVHSDHLGRPQEATDEAGRLAWAADYDAFGAIRRMIVAEVDLPIRSAGQYEDAETGLYYNYHRYFDPGALRYLSEDPAGLQAGLNLYAYCPNPIVQVDPLGHCAGANPHYDPWVAERDAIRRIYGNSPGLQRLGQMRGQATAEGLAEARQQIQQDFDCEVLPWTEEVEGRAPGIASNGSRGDDGIYTWGWEDGQPVRRIYIVPEAMEDPERYRRALRHEAGAIGIVDDRVMQEQLTIPGSKAAADALLPPAAISPRLGRTHALDRYVDNPEAAEASYAQEIGEDQGQGI